MFHFVRDALLSVWCSWRPRRASRGSSGQAGPGVYSGWVGPDGRIEESPGTSRHEALLARFGESDRTVFFSRGAIRYVTTIDHTTIDHLHLELMASNPTALGNAITALSSRWANLPAVEVELTRPSGLVSASSAEVLQELRRRFDNMGSGTR